MTPTIDVQLQFAAITDPGVIRVHNEDSVVIAPEAGLALIADGMGGYNAGEVASQLAASIIVDHLSADLAVLAQSFEPASVEAMTHRLLQTRINQANFSIFNAAQRESQCAGMGTTLVVALVQDERITIAHVGDSRAYRWRQRELVQLTRDHSLLQEQIDAGMLTPVQARYSQNRNLVTRAVGVDPSVIAEIRDFDLRAGDVYLLCSDGLTDMVTSAAITAVFENLGESLQEAGQKLVDLANESGGRDNVSVILIRAYQPGDQASFSAPTATGKITAKLKARVKAWLA